MANMPILAAVQTGSGVNIYGPNEVVLARLSVHGAVLGWTETTVVVQTAHGFQVYGPGMGTPGFPCSAFIVSVPIPLNPAYANAPPANVRSGSGIVFQGR